MSVGTRRTLRVLLTLVSALGLMFTVSPVAASAADSSGVGTGSGLRGSAVLSDSAVGPIRVVAYLVTPDGEDWTADLKTQPDGTFDFPGLSAGSYLVRFSRSGYRSQCFGGATCTEIAVVNGQAAVLEPATLVLTTPGTIRGSVVGSDGKPLAGATITATNDTAARSTETDATGAWSLAGVATDVGWYLTYSKDGLASYSEWSYPEEGVTTTLAQVRLLAPGSVVGIIRDDAEAGVAGADVYLSSADGESLHVVTGASGTYAFTPSPGRYSLSASAAGHPATYYPGVQEVTDASLIAVKERGAVVVNLTLVDAVTLTGLVTDNAGRPLKAEVALYRKDLGQIRSAWADTDGRYTFGDLWPGQFSVRGGLTGLTGHTGTWLGGAVTEAGATWVTATSGTETLSTIILPVKDPITVTGTVSDIAGDPVRDVTVRLDSAYEAVTDTSGAFTMTGDEPGTFDVTIEAGNNQVCGADAAACSPATITVPAAGATGVAIGTPRLGSLSGTLTLPDGLRVDWGDISLQDLDGHEVAFAQFSATAPYSLGRVPFGTYELVVKGDELAGLRASVIVSGDITRDISMITGFSIVGVVTIPAGVGWVDVVALDAASGRQVGYDRIDTESTAPSYLLSHLPPGEYRVGARYDDSRWEWYPSGTDPRTATAVQLVDESVTGINITLPAATGLVRVSGRVILPIGVPAARAADLDLWLENDDSEHRYVPSIAVDGTYSADVPTGDYGLHLDGDTQLMTTAVDQALVVTGPLTHDVKVTLGGMLTGRLVDADGVAIDGWVKAGSDDSAGHTDRWGYWTFGPLDPGALRLESGADDFMAATFGPYTVVAGQSVDTGAQRFVASGRLPVRIPDVGDTVVKVLVTDPVGSTLASQDIWPGNTGWFDGLPAGDVLVRFSGQQIVKEWWRDAESMSAATQVKITGNASAALLAPDLALAAPPDLGTIAGKITNSTGIAGVLRVNVYGEQEDTATVNPDGTYSVQVPEGSYQVRASVCSGSWIVESGCMGESAVLWYPGTSAGNAETIDVTSARTTADVNVELGGSVSFLTSPKPVVTGAVAVGGVLTAAAGAWVPAADQLTYRWERAGVAIVGATAPTYTLAAADFEHTITVTVTATATGRRTTSRTSAPTATVVGGVMTAGAVSITGSATVGSTLTVVRGTWLPVATTLAYQWRRDGVAVDGATGQTFALSAADFGRTITVTVTGSASGWLSTSRTSAATARVAGGVITAGVVRISGSATVGSTLTVVPGAWLPVGTTLSYQWLRDGDRIGGATASKYAVRLVDVGARLSVAVSGTRAGYAAVVGTSASTAAVPGLVFTAVPTPRINGTVKVGSILTVDAGAWAPSPVTLAYQWLRNGAVISRAVGRTYMAGGSDFAKTISVQVMGSKPGYVSAARTSAPTAKVASSTMKTVAPTISGTLRVGAQLTARTTGWVPGDARFRYKWLRSGKTITGATAISYTLSSKDLGKTIKVTVTGSGTGYPPASATSKSTKKVGKGTIVTATPKIAGTAQVGVKLRVPPGTWKPAGITFSYQWYRSGKKISGARSATYTPTASDLRKKLTVKVTGSKTAFTTASKTSSATPAVAPGVLTAGTATITGKVRVGQVLTAKPGTWKPSGISWSYQWRRDRVAIGKATRGTYKPVAADLGATITVVVTGRKSGYATKSVTSAPTLAVAAA